MRLYCICWKIEIIVCHLLCATKKRRQDDHNFFLWETPHLRTPVYPCPLNGDPVNGIHTTTLSDYALHLVGFHAFSNQHGLVNYRKEIAYGNFADASNSYVVFPAGL